MKMILQKHTSKFVAGLFNSLGITACVALTSCGDQDKGKQTESQGENLKNGLTSKGLDEKDAKVIADWLNSNGKDSTYKLSAKDLQEIFKNSPDKLNEVAEKLGVELTESDDEPDVEKKKEINEWLNKLSGLNDKAFDGLNDIQKKTVARKFVDGKIDINNDQDIKTNLGDFIKEVLANQTAGIVKFETGKVFVNEKDYPVNTLDEFKSFVAALSQINISKIEGKFDFKIAGNKLKICGGADIDVSENFDWGSFFNCLVDLKKLNKPEIEIKSSEIKAVSNLTDGKTKNLKGFSFGGFFCASNEQCACFWTLVAKYSELFSNFEGNKTIEIEKDDSKNAVVKILDLKCDDLKWSDVVDDVPEKVKAPYDKIFAIKQAGAAVKHNIVITNDGYKVDNGADAKISDLTGLKTLVDYVNNAEKLDTTSKIAFSFGEKVGTGADNKKGVKIGTGDIFDITGENAFSTLLGYIAALSDKNVCDKIAISVEDAAVKLGGNEIDETFSKSKTFWKAVKDNVGTFGSLPLKNVAWGGNTEQNVKIGNSFSTSDLKWSDVAESDTNEAGIKEEWNGVFSKKG